MTSPDPAVIEEVPCRPCIHLGFFTHVNKAGKIIGMDICGQCNGHGYVFRLRKQKEQDADIRGV